jgi:hypothetical protein
MEWFSGMNGQKLNLIELTQRLPDKVFLKAISFTLLKSIQSYK